MSKAFLDVYKGVLGEKIFEFVCDEVDIKIENINDPEKFELFDFVVFNQKGEIIAIDVKFWEYQPESFDYENEKPKILDKMTQIGAKN